MTSQHFSIKEALSFGWKTTKENIFFLGGTFLFFILWAFFLDRILYRVELYERTGLISIMAGLVGLIVSLILEMGLLRIGLDFVEQAKPSFWRLFSSYPLFFKYAAALILYNILVLIGLILLIVPGIILALGLMFYSYLIIDLGLNPIPALKKSWEITRGAKWKLLGFSILAGLINILGAILLLVGLLITLPLTLLATAYLYRQLLTFQAGSPDIHPVPSAPKEILKPL